jgi:hypothetical protein
VVVTCKATSTADEQMQGPRFMHPGAAVTARVMTAKRVETATATSERGGKCVGKKCKKASGCKGLAEGRSCEGGSGRSDSNCEEPGCGTSGSKDKGPRATRQTTCPDRRHRRVPDVLLLVPHHPAELRGKRRSLGSSPPSIELHAVVVKAEGRLRKVCDGPFDVATLHLLWPAADYSIRFVKGLTPSG